MEQLSKDEREQLLYNHIRLGAQSAFKRQLKPHLDTVAVHQRFSPRSHGVLEIRLHEQLLISSSALNDFVGAPYNCCIVACAP
ncbi:hypothetical protein ACVI1L_004998 [Bradyrhizobium sp. USDA 4516]